MLTDERINKLISMQKFWLRLGQDSANYIRLELLDFARAVEAEVRQAQPSAQGEALSDFDVEQDFFHRSAKFASAPAAPAQAVPLTPGLSMSQEPKYTVSGSAIVNRASGEAIPADEPVFILRARDSTALATLVHYYTQHISAQNMDHACAVFGRVQDFQRFIAEHPTRMKYPDTERGIAPKAAQEKTDE